MSTWVSGEFDWPKNPGRVISVVKCNHCLSEAKLWIKRHSMFTLSEEKYLKTEKSKHQFVICQRGNLRAKWFWLSFLVHISLVSICLKAGFFCVCLIDVKTFLVLYQPTQNSNIYQKTVYRSKDCPDYLILSWQKMTPISMSQLFWLSRFFLNTL